MQTTILIITLATIGLAVATYTALHQKFPKLPSFCFTRSLQKTSCKEILHGKFAKIFIIPNSWLGIAGYLVLIATYYYAKAFSSIGADKLFTTGATISTAALIFSYYLLYVQAFKLKKFCIFCLTSTAIITLITILSITLI